MSVELLFLVVNSGIAATFANRAGDQSRGHQSALEKPSGRMKWSKAFFRERWKDNQRIRKKQKAKTEVLFYV